MNRYSFLTHLDDAPVRHRSRKETEKERRLAHHSDDMDAEMETAPQ